MRMYSYFSMLPVTAQFVLNGTAYQKASTRTARILPGQCGAGRTFYIAMRDLCVVGEYEFIY